MTETPSNPVAANHQTLLPDELPPKWIEQIQKASKRDSVKVIALTSILAAILSLFVNFLLEIYKTSVADQRAKQAAIEAQTLETLKVRNVHAAKIAEEKRQLLLQLGDKVRELDEALEVAVKTFQASSGNQNLIRSAQASLKESKRLMIEVFKINNDSRIDLDISQTVKRFLDSLAPFLHEATNNSREFERFVDYYNRECKKGVLEMRKSIQETTNKSAI